MRYTASTSAQAYSLITESGVLSRRRQQVYDQVYAHGPISARGVWDRIHVMHGQSGVPQHSIGPRFRELEELGLIETFGAPQPCPKTGMKVQRYVTTDVVIDRAELKKYRASRRNTELQRLRDQVEQLAIENANLQQRNAFLRARDNVTLENLTSLRNSLEPEL